MQLINQIIHKAMIMMNNRYSNKLKEDRYNFNEEDLKPYLSLGNVLKGLFNLTDKLFDVKVAKLEDRELKKLKISTWHKDVQVFKLSRDNKLVSYLYFDPYSRPGDKNGGAWM